MTGPEHYQIAEKAALLAKDRMAEAPEDPRFVDNLLRLASVHAQLAQAAATIDAAKVEKEYVSRSEEAWEKVLK